VHLPEPVVVVPVRVPGPRIANLTLPLDRVGRRLPTRRGPPAPATAT